MPTTTSRLGLQQPVGGDPVSELRVAITANAATLDSAVLVTSGTLAGRPISTGSTPGVVGRQYLVEGDSTPANNGILWEDYGAGWIAVNAADQAPTTASQRTLGTGANQALPGNYSGLTKVWRQTHSFTMDDQTSPNPTASILGSFFVDCATDETVTLLEVITHCVTVGSTPSTFKVQYDHASPPTLADVPGLAALSPTTTATIIGPTGGPLPVVVLDRIVVVATNASVGNSLGVTIEVVTEHTA